MREEYDVFLSHNSQDKAEVEKVAVWLQEAQLRPFFDKWDLRPGQLWQPALEQAIQGSRAAAILLGPHQMGRWQDQEMQAFLVRAARREMAVIPVILPGVPADFDMGLFLSLRTWVDLRPSLTDEGLGQLYYGITSKKWMGPVALANTARPLACHNLPFPTLGEGLKGREDLLTDLETSLTSGSAVALTQPQAIHGLGGVGKTRLAVEYAWRSGARYRYAFFVDAESPSALHRNLARLAELGPLGIRPPEGAPEEDAVRSVRRWLQQNPSWLLILDNVDSPEAQTAVRELLPLSQGHILITTRQSIWPPVVLARTVDTLARKDSVALLLERSAAGRTKLPHDEDLADQLAGELGDLPLALELAAAYLDVQGRSFEQYLAAWERDRAQVLAWFEPGATTYQTSVARAWNQTMAHLSLPAQALLRLLAHLAPEPIDEGLVEAGAEALRAAVALLAEETEVPVTEQDPDPAAALAELRRYSLIKRDGPTFTVHRMVQEVVRSRVPGERAGAWVGAGVRWLQRYAPANPDDPRTWSIWEPLRSHVERIVELAEASAMAASASTLMNGLGLLLLEKALYRQAEPILRRVVSLVEGTLGPQHPATARELNNLASLPYVTGRYRDAEPLYRRACTPNEDAPAVWNPSLSTGLNNLAQLVLATGRYEEAELLQRRALDLAEGALGSGHPSLAYNLNNLARLLESTGRFEEAESLQRRSLALAIDSLGPQVVATNLGNLALLLQATGRFEEAESLFRQALDLDEKALGAEHPAVASDLNNLAMLLHATGRSDEAEPLQRRALGIHEAVLGPEHPYVATSLNNLAQLLMAAGRYKDAELLQRRAITVGIAALGLEHPYTARGFNNLAQLLQATGRLDEAEQLLWKALGLHENALGPQHPEVARDLNNLAMLLKTMGRAEEAVPLQRRALTILEAVFGPHHPDSVLSLKNLAIVLHATGRFEETELATIEKRAAEAQLGPSKKSVG